MGIIGFIPYFNWLSWVFAWLDTSRPRYLVYSIVYLAPYLRTNLSLSLDESWLPITGILVCIIHIQLEASIRNGDLEGFAFFNKASKLVSPFIEKNDSVNSHDKSSGGRSKKHGGLPPSAEGIGETREKKSE
ncbi:uncharacterized protein LOC110103366 isoform X3 [Dendrobium catenatum]|nr:uncharacterized protein LOC110103366 isoform X3 [Dendrobium catenatum]